jgi:hypothetical protein
MYIHNFLQLDRTIVHAARHGCRAALAMVLLAACLGPARPSGAQSAPAAQANDFLLFAGFTATGSELQYGDRKMLGFTGFVDVDTRRRYGLEAETGWAIYHQTANVHTSDYLLGPRYRFPMGRLQPYAKVLVGIGEFNFPYNYAHGSYLLVAPGGGVDLRLSRRLRLRLADCEYQYWPQFTYGSMSALSVSSGIKIRVF